MSLNIIALSLFCIYIYIVDKNTGFSKIWIFNKSNISNDFIKSVRLFNRRINYINNLYFNTIKCRGNRKTIVVLLYYKAIKTFINNNLLFLKQKYHDKLIFFVTENKSITEIYRNIEYNVVDISNIFYKFPYGFNKSAHISSFKKRGIWNYQHMCRFFFRDIFLHPALCDTDLYMRLDSDSVLNTKVNLFRYMKENIVYMNNKIMNDDAGVVIGLKQFTYAYINNQKIEIKNKFKFKDSFNKTCLMYYNNFEICRMKFFRSKEMLKFSNLVDLSYGQFIYRWGDAPLRYISLSMFADNYSIIKIPNFVNYHH